MLKINNVIIRTANRITTKGAEKSGEAVIGYNEHEIIGDIMESLKRCKRCLLPETHETLILDKDGICNICRSHEIKNEINWERKLKDFDKIIEEHKGKYKYDCIVPFSGGKDSKWTLYFLK